MDWGNIGKKLLSFGAPILGTALGGPAGGLAAKAAVSAIASKFGMKEEDIQPDTISTMIDKPEFQLKFRELEIEEKIRLQELMNQEAQMYLADRQNARQREAEITKATGKRDINLYILSYLFISGFFTLTGFMLYLLLWESFPENIPQSAVMLLGLLIGALNSGVVAIVQYFFGSSKSSTDKTELLAKMK